MVYDFSRTKNIDVDTGGYTGRLVQFDMKTKEVSLYPLEADALRNFLGGCGLAAYIMCKEDVLDCEPLSEENPLIFLAGPLTGSITPSSSRCTVSAISPLTGIWGEAHFGGDWPDELKTSGFDGVILKGASDIPVYLYMHNGIVEVLDAGWLWGINTLEAEVLLRKKHGDSAKVLCIGRAGENMQSYAAIISEPKKGRAAARCGLGALMGQKKLKAIVVEGRDLPPDFYDPEGLKSAVKSLYEQKCRIDEDRKEKFKSILKPGATSRNLAGIAFKRVVEVGGAPIKNWQIGKDERAIKLIEEMDHGTQLNCRRCSLHDIESRINKSGDRKMVWESWAPLGLNCQIYDEGLLQKAYIMCNDYGLDTISAGNSIAFAFECFEQGLITAEDTGGMELSWGNGEAALFLIDAIGNKQGIGALLGMGVRRAAELIGKNAIEFAIHVKGLDLAAHDPRASNALALACATGSTGGTHVQSFQMLDDYYEGLLDYTNPDLGYKEMPHRSDVKGKGRLVALSQNFGDLLDSLVVCKYFALQGRGRVTNIAQFLKAITGWDMDVPELIRCGERIFNLRRMINVRRGISRKDDTLPPRILSHKKETGQLPFLGEMLNEYYAVRGWSSEGVPEPKKLQELGIYDLT